MKLFFATLGFLTRFPIFFQDDTILSDKAFAKGILFYPLIGMLVGLTCAGVAFIPYFLKLPLLAAIFAVLTEICVTGAFHLDGLSDTCDGLFSSRDKERMLEIMHDSRAGTNGVAAIVFDVLLKTICLSYLPSAIMLPAVILMPVAGKTITPVLMHSQYARKKSGLGSIYLSPTYTFPMILAMLFGVMLIALWLKNLAWIPIIFIFLSAILFRSYCYKKIDGMTGDTLGAGCEIAEIVFLITVLLQSKVLEYSAFF